MHTAEEMYSKAQEVWNTISRDDVKGGRQWAEAHRNDLLVVVSYLNQAIQLSQETNAIYLAAMSHAMCDLLDFEKARIFANKALVIEEHTYQARYTLFIIALKEYQDEFVSGAGIWGTAMNLMGVGKQSKLQKAFEDVLLSFKWWTATERVIFADVSNMAQTLTTCADIFPKLGFGKNFARDVLQTIVNQLSGLSDCGEYEEEIRKCQAVAEGALALQ